jgi:hypothetical protein
MSASYWLDDAGAVAGERTDGKDRFNILLRHEGLVRLCSDLRSGDDFADPSFGDSELASRSLGATTVASLGAVLHERCSVHVREGFEDIAKELQCERGKHNVLKSKVLIPSVRTLRMEPAELLTTGETRLTWRDAKGLRHGQTVRWSVDGLALRVVDVLGPPPTHREWMEALTTRSPTVSHLLGKEALLHDVDDGTGGGPLCSGADRVLPRLLRWSAAAAATEEPLRISRTSHLTKRLTDPPHPVGIL